MRHTTPLAAEALSTMTSPGSPLFEVFDSLSERQRETMALLGEGCTSKEIARSLGLSESAVVQRIETVRRKAGGVLRKDLARNYRTYVQSCARGERDAPLSNFGPPTPEHPSFAGTCNGLTGKSFQLSAPPSAEQTDRRKQPVEDMLLGDAIPFEIASPWGSQSEPAVVPGVLEGRSAALNRMLAAMGLALGMLVLCLVLLAVASEIGELV